jgi:hypothetical protein
MIKYAVFWYLFSKVTLAIRFVGKLDVEDKSILRIIYGERFRVLEYAEANRMFEELNGRKT